MLSFLLFWNKLIYKQMCFIPFVLLATAPFLWCSSKKKKRKELRIIYKLQFLSEINQCNLKPPFQFISALLSLINCRPHMCTYQHYTKKKKMMALFLLHIVLAFIWPHMSLLMQVPVLVYPLIIFLGEFPNAQCWPFSVLILYALILWFHRDYIAIYKFISPVLTNLLNSKNISLYLTSYFNRNHVSQS